MDGRNFVPFLIDGTTLTILCIAFLHNATTHLKSYYRILVGRVKINFTLIFDWYAIKQIRIFSVLISSFFGGDQWAIGSLQQSK